MFTEPTQKHILIVEDEADLRDSLQISLEHAGYRVTTNQNTEEALQQIEALKPDLILLDILTGAMHASLFLQRLRNLPEDVKDTKVIVLTNLDDEPTRQKMEQYGISSYLVKVNVSLQEILDYIDTTLLSLDTGAEKPPMLEL